MQEGQAGQPGWEGLASSTLASTPTNSWWWRLVHPNSDTHSCPLQLFYPSQLGGLTSGTLRRLCARGAGGATKLGGAELGFRV